ncbi:MAG: hypothetical protein JXR76_25690 [Deltaproteobacteria bacterium]|nr:hypothetical protein [Deltaproteobacteria bacterium]
MIEPMEKLLLVCRQQDKKRMLRLVRGLCALHLVPVDDHPHLDLSHLETQLNLTRRAIKIAAAVKASSFGWTEMTPDELVTQILKVEREIENTGHNITRLRLQLERQARFGDVSMQDVAQLTDAGLPLSFWRVAPGKLSRLTDANLIVIDSGHGKNHAVVVANGLPQKQLEQAEAIPLEFPRESANVLNLELYTLEIEALELKRQMQQLAASLLTLRHREDSLLNILHWQQAMAGAFSDESVFIATGWIPIRRKDALQHQIDAAPIVVGLQFVPPQKGEQPPTLWTPPAVARPVNALFRILGVMPGYRENDVSLSFMVALPVFCALLIADGGYGLLLVLSAMIGFKIAKTRPAKEMAQLILIIGVAAVLWGIMIASFFGFDLGELTQHSGGLATFCYMCSSIRLFEADLSSAHVVNQMMAVSFVLGAIHMSFARVWRGWSCLPSWQTLSHLGWAAIVWGMLFLTNTLVLDAPVNPLMKPLMAFGAALVVLFSEPGEKLFKRLALGVAGLPLGALSVLGDTISYIRLMAVGLASTILGATFNLLAEEVAQVSLIGAAAVFVLGHSLNIALALVALFAHGVRLNMLEFSNHLGMGWTGYPYTPFGLAGKEN